MWQIISALTCGIISTIEVIIFFSILLNKSSIQILAKKIVLILFISFIYAIIYLNLNGTTKSIIIFMINIYFYKKIFKISYKQSIFINFLCMVIIVLTELIEFFFVTEILQVSKEFCYTYAGSIISNLIICFIFILVTLLFKKILKKLINTRIENNKQIVIFSALIFICIVVFFYTIINEYAFNKEEILYLIAIIILLIVLFSLIKQTIENNKLTKKYDKLLEFMTTYENEIEKQRVLRHETKNEFLTIKAKINDKQKNKEIIDYIDEILKEKITVKQEEYAKFGYLPANGIKGLCYLKTQEAQDKGLNTNINISKRIKKSNIYTLNIKEQKELGKILGVLLDNAIEASLSSKEKQFGIEVYLNLNKECQIIISNSYNGNLNLNKIGKEKFSTKGKNRGHGLLLVKHIIENNNVFDIKNNVTNELYIQTVTINKT